ncbi:MAG: zf-TFIIB domain-containing protein [Alphaproteobacteria bacterium]|nr:zf-TFIIB domain-containing protein [Alphaproteobacteria bacterium]
MPLLTCPNDNTPMQPVKREGVEIDICTLCRGVWLDRGELEKLLGVIRAADADEQRVATAAEQQRPAPQQAYPPHQPYPQQPGYGEHGEYGERGEHGERGEYVRGRHGARRFGLFDIFD